MTPFEHRPARRAVTIRDVAVRAGVAISSVSSAVNGRPGVSDATRARIQKAADDLGYVPSVRAQSLSTKRAFAVGLVLQRDPDVLETDPFFGGFIAGIEAVLSARGYALVLQVSTSPKDDCARYRRLALSRRVDGVYLNELRVADPRLALVRELGLPAVAIAESSVDWSPAVLQDTTPAIRQLADALIAWGHTRFAFVGGPTVYLHANHRRDVWTRALLDRGVSQHECVKSDFTYAGGARAADRLLTRPPGQRPTAVFCANDLMAVGFIVRAQELGLDVPRDVAVAGLDGTKIGTYIRPALTTITTSPRALGKIATELLLASIIGKTPEGPVAVHASELLLRDSVGAARITDPG